MVKIAICDDNNDILDMEKTIIERYMDSHGVECQVHQFHEGQALLDTGEDIDGYSLIFLDVEMEGIDGIETARRIREKSEVPIAFVTAHITYSLEGYKVNAVRYILKEVDTFRDGICECLSLLFNQRKHPLTERLELDLKEGKREIPLEKLVYIESRHHYCYFHVKEKGNENLYIKREKLDEIEKQIHNEIFLRIHKSCLVNLSFVAEVKRYQVQLITGETLSVAQSKYLNVEKEFLNYCGKFD